jgi:hypothetical protein
MRTMARLVSWAGAHDDALITDEGHDPGCDAPQRMGLNTVPKISFIKSQTAQSDRGQGNQPVYQTFKAITAPLVAIIGDENAGRAPANPQMDGAMYARASPFHTNDLP